MFEGIETCPHAPALRAVVENPEEYGLIAIPKVVRKLSDRSKGVLLAKAISAQWDSTLDLKVEEKGGGE